MMEKPSFLTFLVAQVRGAWKMILAASLVGMLSGGSSVGLLALITTTLEYEDAGRSLKVLGVAFVGLCLVVTSARIGARYLLVTLGQQMVMDLRLRMCRRIVGTPLERLEKLGPYRLLVTLTDDINSVMQALLVVPVVCINGTIVLGCLGYLAWLNLPLFGLLLVALLVGAVSYQLPAQLGLRRFREAREQEDVLFGHFRSLTQGIKELQLHEPRRAAFDGLLFDTSDLMRRLRVMATMIYGTATAWGHLLFFVVIGVLLFARPAFIDAGTGTLVGYTLVLLYMMTPLHTLLDSVPIVSRADVAVEKINRLGLDLAPEQEVAEPAAAAPPPAWSHLRLDGVTYAYHLEEEDREFVLGPIDLDLHPGEVVFLVGGNGSGKTTLAKLLVGLYRPQAGHLEVDGVKVDEDRLADYRSLFSVVFDDFHLFEQLLGLEGSELEGAGLDERAQEHLRDLRLSHKVRVEDGHLSTVNLSQGQRKRLALLTAYLEDRPIYLFDEWAADQDPLFKEVFYHQILPELRQRGKTVVAISHDDRYFSCADRILKLDEGRLLDADAAAAAPVGVTAVVEEPMVVGVGHGEAAGAGPGLGAPGRGTPGGAMEGAGGGLGTPAPEPPRSGEPWSAGGDGSRVSDAGEPSARGEGADPGRRPADGRSSSLRWLLAAAAVTAAALLSLLPLRPPAATGPDAGEAEFSAARAAEVVEVIARRPHPTGSAEARRVRDELVRRLDALGLETQVQRATVAEHRWGRRAKAVAVENVLGRLPGRRGTGDGTLLLVAHYDSEVTSPGAADDAAGVAAILEAVRALAAGPTPANDVVVAFTDAEESGLAGARAFRDHPWAAGPVLLLNFEARGVEGPSLMFETAGVGPGLMRGFAAAVDHPVAFSFSSDVYRYMPNSTDFEVLAGDGRRGFNFAFIHGSEAYHNSLDRPERLDRRSLQHHGESALGMLRAFADADLAALPPAGGASYFPLPGAGLVVYAGAWNLPLLLLLAALLAAAVVVALRAGRLAGGRVVFGLLLPPAAVLAAGAVVWGCTRLAGLLADLRAVADPGWLLAGWVTLAGGVLLAVWWAARRLGYLHAGVGGVSWVLLLAAAALVLAPATAYLLLLPGLCFATALLVAAARPPASTVTLAAGVAAAALPWLLWTPVLTLLAATFGAGAGPLLAVLLALATLPLGALVAALAKPEDRGGKLAAAGLVVAGVALVVGVLATSGHGPDHPRGDSLFYAVDPAAAEALWLSFDDAPDAWTSAVLDETAPRRTLEDWFEDPESLLSSPAPVLDLAPPQVIRLAGEGVADRYRVRLRSPRRGAQLGVELSSPEPVLALTVDGERVELPPPGNDGDPRRGEAGHRALLRLIGSPENGFVVDVELDAPAPLTLVVNDRAYGLPEPLAAELGPRPAHLRPHRYLPSDISLVRGRYTLPEAGEVGPAEPSPSLAEAP